MKWLMSNICGVALWNKPFEHRVNWPDINRSILGLWVPTYNIIFTKWQVKIQGQKFINPCKFGVYLNK